MYYKCILNNGKHVELNRDGEGWPGVMSTVANQFQRQERDRWGQEEERKRMGQNRKGSEDRWFWVMSGVVLFGVLFGGSQSGIFCNRWQSSGVYGRKRKREKKINLAEPVLRAKLNRTDSTRSDPFLFHSFLSVLSVLSVLCSSHFAPSRPVVVSYFWNCSMPMDISAFLRIPPLITIIHREYIYRF